MKFKDLVEAKLDGNAAVANRINFSDGKKIDIPTEPNTWMVLSNGENELYMRFSSNGFYLMRIEGQEEMAEGKEWRMLDFLNKRGYTKFIEIKKMVWDRSKLKFVK
jgi:hypothetical protein